MHISAPTRVLAFSFFLSIFLSFFLSFSLVHGLTWPCTHARSDWNLFIFQADSWILLCVPSHSFPPSFQSSSGNFCFTLLIMLQFHLSLSSWSHWLFLGPFLLFFCYHTLAALALMRSYRPVDHDQWITCFPPGPKSQMELISNQ